MHQRPNAALQTLRARRRDVHAGRVASAAVPRRKRRLACNGVWIVVLVQSVVIVGLLALYLPSGHNRGTAVIETSSSVVRLPSPSPLHVECDAFVTVYTYDRPRHLYALLRDIAREADASGLNVGVNVIDDNSYGCVFAPVRGDMYNMEQAADPLEHLVAVPLGGGDMPCVARDRYVAVEDFMRQRGWSMYVAKKRHARRRYWFLIQLAHQLLRKVKAKYFVFLPDDDRLASRFFEKVDELWTSIEDRRKMTLMLHVEETREHVAVWTDVKPRFIGGGVSRIGWVESGNFVCTHELLTFLNWSFPRIDEQRWVRNPTISSGVGATLSELLHGNGKRMYRSQQSLVGHMGVTLSKMNAEFRGTNVAALVTKYFADGDDVYKRLLAELPTVTASMASQWKREAALQLAVQSLAQQVDHLNVYLNGYDSVPAFLRAPYITVVQSQNGKQGDIGDIGKFFWCNQIETEFHLTVDDDIIYPPNYVQQLVAEWRRFKPPVVVGVHGIRIKQDELKPPAGRRGNGYYGSREVWMATENVTKPVNVHIIGTGTMLYRPSDVGEIDLHNVFREPNMADIWFGLLMQRLKVPMVVIPRREGWIQEVPGTFEDSIYKRSTRSRTSDRLQTRAATSIDTWVLYEPISIYDT